MGLSLRSLYYAAIAERSEQRAILRLLRRAGVGPSARILDVGCGYGRNLLHLREGGLQPVGVEINPELAAAVREKGFTCHAPGDPALAASQWDAILIAHVVEHFAPADLLELLDRYLALLGRGGHLVIATPLPHDDFYEDFDHIRPYTPFAINQVLGGAGRQIQMRSAHELELVELWYRRQAPLLRRPRPLYLPRLKVGRALVAATNVALRAAHLATFGLVGSRTAWVGVYRKV